VIATFYPTEPATLIAERGDSVSLMYQVVSASGAKYEGRNELFWEHQGEATIRWGFEAPEMHCKKSP
jgi:membrane-bound inhibitor of C-type lysozyme